jgi:YD repeat-containing protein
MKYRLLYSIIMLLLLAAPVFSAPITYEYDELDRLHVVTLENGQKITYEYDEIGNMISKTPSGDNVFTISASATDYGSIYPNGNTNITAGGSKTYSITPVTGYLIVNVYIDGVAQGAITSYTFTNLAANHTITANFGNTVTFVAGVSGSLAGATSQNVNYNGSTTAVTAVPATGYHFANWTGTGGFVTSTSNPLTVTNVTAAQAITANFAVNSTTTNYSENFDALTSIPAGWSAQGTAWINNVYYSAAKGLQLGDGNNTDGNVSFVAPVSGNFSLWYYKLGAWGYYWDESDWDQYGTNAGAMTISVNGAVVYTATADTGWVKTPLFSVHTGDTIKIAQSGSNDDGGAYCDELGGSCNVGDDRYDDIFVYIDDVGISGGTNGDTTPPTTTATPGGGTYSSARTVTLSANETATIYYTTDSTIPTTSSAVYSAPLTISATKTLKYFAKDLAGNVETIKAQTYIIDTNPSITTATPGGGSYTSAQTVTLSANEPATIYYTTNGTDPTTSSSVYSAPLTISATKTLKYFGKDLAGNAETVKTQNYIISSGGGSSSFTESFDVSSTIPAGWSVQGTASINNMYHSAAKSLQLGDGNNTDGNVTFVAPVSGNLSFWYYKFGAWGYYWQVDDWNQFGTNAGTMTVSVNGAVVYTAAADTGWVKTPLFSVHAGDTIKITQSGNIDDGGAYCDEIGGHCTDGDDPYFNISVYIDDVSIAGGS